MTVTVIIHAAADRERLPLTLASLERQEPCAPEIIVVDAHFPRDARMDDGVLHLRAPESTDMRAQFAAALPHAGGEALLFCCAGDLFLPDELARLTAGLDGRPEACAAVGRGRVLCYGAAGQFALMGGQLPAGPPYFPPAAVLFRRSAVTDMPRFHGRELCRDADAALCMLDAVTVLAAGSPAGEDLRPLPECFRGEPRISVVTATRNAQQYLERLLMSTAGQTYARTELIVQDGASTDRTLHILRRHAAGLAHVASEPDTGVYDAWNKALRHVRGEWTIFLGADDLFAAPEVCARCAAHLANLPRRVIFAFGALLLIKEGKPLYPVSRSVHAAITNHISDSGLSFPATFVRTAYLKARGFDASYRIAGDFALTAAAVSRESIYRIPELISFMDIADGLSSNPRYAALMLQERMRVLREHILPRAGALAEASLATVAMVEAWQPQHGEGGKTGGKGTRTKG